MKKKRKVVSTSSAPFFENLPDLIRPELAAATLGLSVATIYDWNYRKHLKRIPSQLFMKINRLLYLRKDELKKWILSLNA